MMCMEHIILTLLTELKNYYIKHYKDYILAVKASFYIGTTRMNHFKGFINRVIFVFLFYCNVSIHYIKTLVLSTCYINCLIVDFFTSTLNVTLLDMLICKR